jgi:hypothetical protein
MLPNISFVMNADEYKQNIIQLFWSGGNIPFLSHHFSDIALHYKPVRVTEFLDCVHHPEF